MSYGDLLRLGVTLRPYDDPPASGGTPSPFEATLGTTLEVLARELRHLDAKTIVLQLGYREQDLRLDGLPRSNARMLHNAVALSFDSKWGALRYATNEFVQRSYRARGEGWEQNLRAIALGMEALRKVDRYGVSKSGEQYRGWRQLGSTSASDGLPGTAGEAAAVVHAQVNDLYDLADIFDDGSAGAGAHRDDAILEAIRRSHPDHGGDSDTFRKVIAAREVLRR